MPFVPVEDTTKALTNYRPGPSGVNLRPGDAIERAEQLAGIPDGLFGRLVRKGEATPDGRRSPKGAFGRAQLMPDTAAELAKKYGGDPANDDDNLRLGARYLRELLDRYKGDQRKAAAAYNWGMGRVDKWDGSDESLPDETRGYLSRIFGGGKSTKPATVLERDMAALRLNSDVGSIAASMTPGLYQYDPDFDPVTHTMADPQLAPYVEKLSAVRSLSEWEARAATIRRQIRDREILDDAGWSGTLQEIGAGVFSLTNLVPGIGGAWRAATRAGRGARALGIGAGSGLMAGTATETLLSASQETRTWEESAWAVGTATVLGGVLGGSIGLMSPRAVDDLTLGVDRSVNATRAAPFVYDDVSKQLAAAGRPEAEAAAGGRLWQAFVESTAAATGKTAEDVYALVKPRVTAGELPDVGLRQSLDMLDPQLRGVVESAHAESAASGRQVWVWKTGDDYVKTLGDRPAGAELVGRVIGAADEVPALYQAARGAIQLADDADPINRITMGAKADASTFLHESGHAFLGAYERMAGASPEIGARMEKLRAWLGNDGTKLTVEQHERFARGFEAYLRDGKAPSEELRSLFDQFRDWLTRIYVRLADLDVELSDDVRDVMDSMLVAREAGAVEPRSLSAAELPSAIADDDFTLARGLGGLANMDKIGRVVSRLPIVGSPDLLLATSPVRATREAVRRLVRPVLHTIGDTRGVTAVENVESAAGQWHGRLYHANRLITAEYGKYVKAATAAGEKPLKRRQFGEQITKAMRRGDRGDALQIGETAKAAVSRAATIYRREVIAPLRDEAIRHGLLTQAQIDKAVRFAESYVPRAWNVDMIKANRSRFTRDVVMPSLRRDWEEAKDRLAEAEQKTRQADEQLRAAIAAAEIEAGPEAAAFIAEGRGRTPAQALKANVNAIEEAIGDTSLSGRFGDADRARAKELIAKYRTPAYARDGMEGVNPDLPGALSDAEAQELQDIALRTLGTGGADDIGQKATRAIEALRGHVEKLRGSARTDAIELRRLLTQLREVDRAAAKDHREAEEILTRLMSAGDKSRAESDIAAVLGEQADELAHEARLAATREGRAEDTVDRRVRREEQGRRVLSKIERELEKTGDRAEKLIEEAMKDGQDDKAVGRAVDKLLRDRKALYARRDKVVGAVERMVREAEAAEDAARAASESKKAVDGEAKAAGKAAAAAEKGATKARAAGGELATSLTRMRRILDSHRERAIKIEREAEVRAAKRAATIDEADKVAAIRSDHETAVKKSLSQRAKAHRELTKDDNIGRLGEEELAGVADDLVNDLVGHTNNRLQYGAVKLQGRGPVQEKTFNVRDTDAEEWLDNDIEALTGRYMATLGSDVEMVRAFGDVNGDSARNSIIDAYAEKSAAIPDGKGKAQLERRLKRDLETWDALVARQRGLYGLPRDASEVVSLRAGRLLKALNFMRAMGWGPLGQLTDVGRVIFTSGIQRFLGDAVMPLVSNWKAVKLTSQELRLLDVANEITRSNMAMRGAEIFDDYAPTSAFERMMQQGARGASRIFGLDHWNIGLKTIGGMIGQSKLVDGVRALASGDKLSTLEVADLSRVGIGRAEAKMLVAYIDKFGKDVNGVTIPSTPDWQGDNAGDAVRIWRAAVRQLVDDQIVNPGQDRALWMSKSVGSILGQLETFNLVSTQRTILAGMQRANGAVALGSAVMVGLGMLSYYIRASIAGWPLPEDAAGWIAQGVKGSGLLAAVSSMESRVAAATRGAVSIDAIAGGETKSRYAAAGPLSLFGPSGSLLQQSWEMAQSASAGDWNARNTHQLRTTLLLQNALLFRWAFDEAELMANEALGIKNRPRR